MPGYPKGQLGPPAHIPLRRDALAVLTPAEQAALIIAARVGHTTGWAREVAAALGWPRRVMVFRRDYVDEQGGRHSEMSERPGLAAQVTRELARLKLKVETAARQRRAAQPKEEPAMAGEANDPLHNARVALKIELDSIKEQLAALEPLNIAKARLEQALRDLSGEAATPEPPAVPEPEPTPDEAKRLDEREEEERAEPQTPPLHETDAGGRRKPDRIEGTGKPVKGQEAAHPTLEEVRDCVTHHLKDTPFTPRSVASIIGGSKVTVRRRLEILKDRGVVNTSGKGAGTKWHYVKPATGVPLSRRAVGNGHDGAHDGVSGTQAPRRGTVPGIGRKAGTVGSTIR